MRVANTIIAGNTVEHAYVGVCLENPTTGVRRGIATSGGGLCSGPIAPGSPAAKAGLVPGDVITAINGTPIRPTDDFIAVIGGYSSPADTVTLTVDDAERTRRRPMKVTLGNRPASAPHRPG